MVRLIGERIYLGTLEREHCKTFEDEIEYDYSNPNGQIHAFLSIEKSDDWFERIKEKQGTSNFWLGVFLNNGTIIGYIELYNIDDWNRSCSLFMQFSKLEYRNKGYGKEVLKLVLNHVFFHLGIERISVATFEINISAQKLLEKCGFKLEGKERKAYYFAGKKYDRYTYGLLVDEYKKME